MPMVHKRAIRRVTKGDAADAPTLSVVVPVFNEEEVIRHSYERLRDVLLTCGVSFEMVFVDDGSRDRSLVRLVELSMTDFHVVVVKLSRNFGQEIALAAGLRQARGRAVVVIDADLQDPPELIPQFLRKWREGNQVVYAERMQRLGETRLKKGLAFLFTGILREFAEVPIPMDAGHCRLLDRRVVDAMNSFRGGFKYFRAMVSWTGFRQVGVQFVRQPRFAGKTKFNFFRLVRLALDGLITFSTLPSFILTGLCLAAGGLVLLCGSAVLIAWSQGVLVLSSWHGVAAIFLILQALQFLALFLLGQYIIRIYRTSLGRPSYIVESVLIQGKERAPGERVAESLASSN